MRKSMIGDGKTYSELSSSFPAIPEGKGRIFIYMTDGGPSALNTFGIVGAALTVDDTLQFISGKTFFYVDLDIGKHAVTAEKVIPMMIVGKPKYKRGKNAIDFELLDRQVKYVKIDFIGFAANLKFGTMVPILLESNKNAETEINNLNFYKNYNSGSSGIQNWELKDSE